MYITLTYAALYFGLNVKFYSAKRPVRIGKTVKQNLISIQGTVCAAEGTSQACVRKQKKQKYT
jgi:hypothetical protein